MDGEEAGERLPGSYLYGGTSGTALFFAAMARVTGDPVCARVARAVLGAVDLDPGRLRELPVDALGLGVCNGVGSVLYAFAAISRLLEDRSHVEAVLPLAGQITPERIAADQRLDVEGGSAGAILGLLALYGESRESGLLERAVQCGEHLLRAARPAGSGGLAWPTVNGMMLAGLAHGAAGIAMSLVRLYEVSGRLPFLEAARGALAFERTVFSPRHGNWPIVVRSEADGTIRRGFMMAWCHGAPGIALARLGCLRVLGDEAVRGELETALASTSQAGDREQDHLCCGNMSHVEALLVAGEVLGRRDLARMAGRKAVRILERAALAGGFRIGGGAPAGFFRGLAGIGYECLRLAYPGQLPSVLLFDREARPPLATPGHGEAGRA